MPKSSKNRKRRVVNKRNSKKKIIGGANENYENIPENPACRKKGNMPPNVYSGTDILNKFLENELGINLRELNSQKTEGNVLINGISRKNDYEELWKYYDDIVTKKNAMSAKAFFQQVHRFFRLNLFGVKFTGTCFDRETYYNKIVNKAKNIDNAQGSELKFKDEISNFLKTTKPEEINTQSDQEISFENDDMGAGDGANTVLPKRGGAKKKSNKKRSIRKSKRKSIRKSNKKSVKKGGSKSNKRKTIRKSKKRSIKKKVHNSKK